jgi:hypothetical protein
MSNSSEILHNPGMSFEQAKAGYIDWLCSMNWTAQPSLLYWWYASEFPVERHSVAGFRGFCDGFYDLLEESAVAIPATIPAESSTKKPA